MKLSLIEFVKEQLALDRLYRRQAWLLVADLPKHWDPQIALEDFIFWRLDSMYWPTRGETVEEC